MDPLAAVYLERLGRHLTEPAADWLRRQRVRLIPRRYLLSDRLVKAYIR